MAAAIAAGFSSIFVTAPTPENLKTLFEFVFEGITNFKLMSLSFMKASKA